MESASAAMLQKTSPMKRGSRPTMTLPSGLREAMKRAMPVEARRTLAQVKSSATMARQPEVPNLICASMSFQFYHEKSLTTEGTEDQGEISIAIGDDLMQF